MQPVESHDDRNRHPSRRPCAVQDVLVRLGLTVPDLGRHDPSGNRQTPVGPSNLLPFSFPFSSRLVWTAGQPSNFPLSTVPHVKHSQLQILTTTRLIAVSPPAEIAAQAAGGQNHEEQDRKRVV